MECDPQVLNPREVIAYLQRRNLISAKSVVETDVMVANVSRRNRNFKVIHDLGPCYFLKQGVGPNRVSSVAREAALYKLFESQAKNHNFVRYLPRFYGYDSKEHILTLELLRNASNLREYHALRGRFSTLLATAMGNALSTLHRIRIEEIAEEDSRSFTHEIPWVLWLHRPVLGISRDISSANFELIKTLQQFPMFCGLLDELREGWKTETLIHRDIKWDNCIAYSQSPSGRKTRLKIIDWELAGFGDPCWDVGSVFNDYLSFWLLSIPVAGETPPDKFLDLATYPLQAMQPAIRSFWVSYARCMKLDAVTSYQWLLRAAQYGAARLVQTAFEQMHMSQQLTGNVICFLQLSLNILQRPREAIIQLLGIPIAQ